MKFDFSKSIETDFRNKLQSDLHMINQNILYITHVVDKIGIIVNQLKIDKGLQKQVDEYFEDETSPQTDSEEQKD